MRGFVITLALFIAPPALACVNDRAVEVEEEEFRSTYGEDRPAAEAEETQRITAGVASGGFLGLLLLGTAFHAARRLDER